MSATVRERELTVWDTTQRVHRAEETIHRWSWTGQLPTRKLGNGCQVHEQNLKPIAAGVPAPRELSFGEWVAASRDGALAAILLPTAVLVRPSLRIERSGLDSATVDASVDVEFMAPDADDTEPIHVLFNQCAQTGEGLHAAAMLPLEVMNALLTGVCQGRWDGQTADAASSFVASQPISLHANGATDIRNGSRPVVIENIRSMILHIQVPVPEQCRFYLFH